MTPIARLFHALLYRLHGPVSLSRAYHGLSDCVRIHPPSRFHSDLVEYASIHAGCTVYFTTRGATTKISEVVWDFEGSVDFVSIFMNFRLLFIHSGYFYYATSSPLLLRTAPDTARILLSRSFA